MHHALNSCMKQEGKSRELTRQWKMGIRWLRVGSSETERSCISRRIRRLFLISFLIEDSAECAGGSKIPPVHLLSGIAVASLDESRSDGREREIV